MIKSRVLIVDDEPQILPFLEPVLKAAEFEVLTAMKGTEIVNYAAAKAPVIILLD